MISPFVRRLRLASELRGLRAEAGLTHDQLAKRIGQSRAQISRLENGHIVDQADVLAILDTLGVDGERWTQIVTISREAGERGWWEYHKAMGDRQRRYADLEAGATSIREYQQNFIPGLLQTPEFVRARTDAGAELEPMEGTSVEGVLAGRAGRQRTLRRPGAPRYEVVIDEVAIRRLSAPPRIVQAQLLHLASAVTCPADGPAYGAAGGPADGAADRGGGGPADRAADGPAEGPADGAADGAAEGARSGRKGRGKGAAGHTGKGAAGHGGGSGSRAQVSLRVLPVDARIDGYMVPRSAFSIYTYADPGDPTVVAVDTVTDDLLLTSADAVSRYEELYRRLRDAALSPHDSLDLLSKAAAELDRR